MAGSDSLKLYFRKNAKSDSEIKKQLKSNNTRVRYGLPCFFFGEVAVTGGEDKWENRKNTRGNRPKRHVASIKMDF